MTYKDALSENLEYCNELAQRINLLAETIEMLGDTLLALEKKVEDVNKFLYLLTERRKGEISIVERQHADYLANKLMGEKK